MNDQQHDVAVTGWAVSGVVCLVIVLAGLFSAMQFFNDHTGVASYLALVSLLVSASFGYLTLRCFIRVGKILFNKE